MGLQLFDSTNPVPIDSIRYDELEGGWTVSAGSLNLMKEKMTAGQVPAASP